MANVYPVELVLCHLESPHLPVELCFFRSIVSYVGFTFFGRKCIKKTISSRCQVRSSFKNSSIERFARFSKCVVIRVAVKMSDSGIYMNVMHMSSRECEKYHRKKSYYGHNTYENLLW